MLDIKLIRDNKAAVAKGLSAKNAKIDLDELAALDKRWREVSFRLD